MSSTVVVGADEAKPQVMVGTIDLFGLRQHSESEIRSSLKIKEGDPFDREQTSAAVAELKKLPGVKQTTLAPITTDGSGRIHLFVGVQEEDAVGFVLRDKPTGETRLPAPLAQIFLDFSNALGPAVRSGKDREDDTQGHALDTDPGMRKAEETAVAQMREEVGTVKAVLRTSASVDDRRAAAWLLGYAPDKKSVTDALVEAARDPDSSVRNNATRALGAIAVLAGLQPELGIRIDPSVFIAMLDSVDWTDRNKAAFVLEGLTKSKPPELLQQLRAHALPDLIEMARWKSTGHALSAALILGRIAGWSDEKTMATCEWGKSDREAIIAAASSSR